ncbi:MAG TPA: radical SAM protein, partial [Candidatus Acidoferrales bacterium]|nr:radical SAM protein [Candidatus Acidoferrales bacterium]
YGLPWRSDIEVEKAQLRCAEVLQLATSLGGRPGAFLLGGGEPLERPDLPELLSGLSQIRPTNLGIHTFGQGATKAKVQHLRSLGVKRVHVPFHCARQDAHDWVTGQVGSLKTAHRAIRACVEADLSVTAEIVLTRPTISHLPETIRVLGHLGVRSIQIRPLTVEQVDGPAFVTLSPRLSLLEEILEQAATVALERRVRLSFVGLPLCIAPRLAPLFAVPDREVWVMSDGSVLSRLGVGEGCPTCPGLPQCCGAPRDYVARFGWEEFSEHQSGPRVQRIEPTPDPSGETVEAMVFSWRGPRRVRCDACADDAGDWSKTQPAYESTRGVRLRLVQAARYRPARLRLVGADLIAHPQAALLIYDAVRLFANVEVAGEASALVDWSDLDLRRLKDLRRIDVALYGPDAASHDAHCGIPGAFAAMLRGVANVCAKSEIAVGAYAVLHDARQVAAFAEAWAGGRLPGEPRFRLSAHGGSLDELLEAAMALPVGAARSALTAVLPNCLCEQAGIRTLPPATPGASPRQIIYGKSIAYESKGSDPIGAFESCKEGAGTCASSDCLGIAEGWQSAARSKRWNLSL